VVSHTSGAGVVIGPALEGEGAFLPVINGPEIDDDYKTHEVPSAWKYIQ